MHSFSKKYTPIPYSQLCVLVLNKWYKNILSNIFFFTYYECSKNVFLVHYLNHSFHIILNTKTTILRQTTLSHWSKKSFKLQENIQINTWRNLKSLIYIYIYVNQMFICNKFLHFLVRWDINYYANKFYLKQHLLSLTKKKKKPYYKIIK